MYPTPAASMGAGPAVSSRAGPGCRRFPEGAYMSRAQIDGVAPGWASVGATGPVRSRGLELQLPGDGPYSRWRARTRLGACGAGMRDIVPGTARDQGRLPSPSGELPGQSARRYMGACRSSAGSTPDASAATAYHLASSRPNGPRHGCVSGAGPCPGRQLHPAGFLGGLHATL
jgi:hypothetical protein